MRYILDHSSKAIALLGFVLLIISLVRDWGYFSVVGSQYLSIQTPYDHLTNSIEWLPQNLALLGFSGLAGWLLGSFPKWLIDHVVAKSSNDPPIYFEGVGSKKNAHLIRLLLLASNLTNLSFAAYIFLFMNHIPIYAGVIAFLIYMAIFTPLSKRLKLRQSWHLPILVAPIVLILAFIFGAVDANKATKRSDNFYRVAMSEQKQLDVQILRSFEKGILVWDRKAKRVALYRWDSISNVSNLIVRSERPFICHYYDWSAFCPNKKPINSKSSNRDELVLRPTPM